MVLFVQLHSALRSLAVLAAPGKANKTSVNLPVTMGPGPSVFVIIYDEA